MPQLIPDNWTDPHFLPTVYSLALAAIGVVCIVAILLRRHRWHALKREPIQAWNIGWMDISLLFCLIFMWWLMVAPISRRIMPLPDPVPPDMQVWQTVVDAALLQGGMALIFIIFRLTLPFDRRPSFSNVRMGSGAAFSCALLYFLAFIPPRFVVELGWTAFLRLLRNFDIPVPMDEQSVVGCFNGGSPPLAYISLILIAGIVAPTVEELVFRAGLYRFLKGRMPRNTAIIVSAGLFAILHGNVLVFPTLMLLGAALCLSYEATGCILVPIFFHALFNLNSIFMIALS
jgi:uncharacterized protein